MSIVVTGATGHLARDQRCSSSPSTVSRRRVEPPSPDLRAARDELVALVDTTAWFSRVSDPEPIPPAG